MYRVQRVFETFPYLRKLQSLLRAREAVLIRPCSISPNSSKPQVLPQSSGILAVLLKAVLFFPNLASTHEVLRGLRTIPAHSREPLGVNSPTRKPHRPERRRNALMEELGRHRVVVRTGE